MYISVLAVCVLFVCLFVFVCVGKCVSTVFVSINRVICFFGLNKHIECKINVIIFPTKVALYQE